MPLGSVGETVQVTELFNPFSVGAVVGVIGTFDVGVIAGMAPIVACTVTVVAVDARIPVESVAVTVTVALATVTVGVPLITPEDVLMARPAGNPVANQVTELFNPVRVGAVVAVIAVPIVSTIGLIGPIRPFTPNVTVVVVVAPLAPLTVTVYVPGAVGVVGVPWIVPLTGSIVSPFGRAGDTIQASGLVNPLTVGAGIGVIGVPKTGFVTV